MSAARRLATEPERLASLRSYRVLDTEVEAVFDDLTRLAARLTGMPISLISLVDSDRQWFKSRVGMDASETPRDIAFCAHALLAPTEPMIVPNALEDSRFADNSLVTGASQVRFYAGVPLVNTEGHALGTLCVLDRVPHQMNAEQRETLVILSRAVMTALELRRALARAADMAMTDALTGLANRRGLVDALERAIARQQRDHEPFGLMYIDLDGFKAVNDTHGHAAGDAVLQAVADALLQRLRRQDLVARLGGDEFAVLPSGPAVPAIAEALRVTINQRTEALNKGVTASIGAVTFLTPPANASAALAAADAIMFAAKTGGRNRVRYQKFNAPAALAGEAVTEPA